MMLELSEELSSTFIPRLGGTIHQSKGTTVNSCLIGMLIECVRLVPTLKNVNDLNRLIEKSASFVPLSEQ